MKIAVYGGTFSPPHKGHTETAAYMLGELRPDKLIIIPALIPPHKETDKGVTPKHRYEMAELAFSNIQDSRIEVSGIELESGGVSYTYNTVLSLREKYGISDRERLILLIGSDMFLSLETWYRFTDLIRLCTFAVADRYNPRGVLGESAAQRVQLLEEQYGIKFIMLGNAPLEISSTELRKSMEEDLPYDGNLEPYLHANVYEYIKRNKLYCK
jgi:nicotinate-nucleotide adenylyltransferase